MPRNKKTTPVAKAAKKTSAKESKVKRNIQGGISAENSRSPGKPLLMENQQGKQSKQIKLNVGNLVNVPRMFTDSASQVHDNSKEVAKSHLIQNVLSQNSVHGHDTRFRSKRSNEEVQLVQPYSNAMAEVDLSRVITENDRWMGDNVAISVHVPEDAFQSDEEIFPLPVEHEDTVQRGERFRQAGQVSGSMAGTAAQVSNYNRMQQMKDDPLFIDMVNKAVAEQFRVEKQRMLEQNDNGNANIEVVRPGNPVQQENRNIVHERVVTPVRLSNNNASVVNNKSPSDTTIYVPTFAKTSDKLEKQNFDSVVDKITQFLDQVRLDSAKDGNGQSQQQVEQRLDTQRNADILQSVNEPVVGPSGVETMDGVNLMGGTGDSVGQARAIAQRMILDAEKFRASIDKPGLLTETTNNLNTNSVFAIDDEFLHITCHVDGALKGKIECGEFIELDKLLPKDPTKKMSNESRMELVNREGLTYFVLASDRDKITGVCKWEQAFRVYAAFYSKANPHRASEIWQYVHIINVAAISYAWDNVACYNYTFRQLMSSNPRQSWASIYHQMWSLAMRDPVTKNYGHRGAAQEYGARTHRDNYC